MSRRKLSSRTLITAKGCWVLKGTHGRPTYGPKRGIKGTRSLSRLVAHVRLGLDLENPTLGALHHCDNPPCFNPDHLFIGSKGDNNLDALRKGRATLGKRVLTEEERHQIRIERKTSKTMHALSLKWHVSVGTIHNVVHERHEP